MVYKSIVRFAEVSILLIAEVFVVLGIVHIPDYQYSKNRVIFLSYENMQLKESVIYENSSYP